MIRLQLLALFVLCGLRSDIGKVYAAGKEPMLLSGTAASNTAGGGVPRVAGSELAHLGNQHLGHVYVDLAK